MTRARALPKSLLPFLPPIGAFLFVSAFHAFIHPNTWFLFYPAIFLTAWLGDFRTTTLVTAATAAAILWSLVPPYHSFFKPAGQEFPAAVFLSSGVLFGWFHDRLRRTLDQLQIFKALIENSSDFIGIANPDGIPIYVNPAGRSMVGLSPEEPVSGTRIPEYYTADQREFAAEVIVKAMMKRGHWKGETFFRNFKTDAAIPVWDEHFMIRDPSNGRVLGMGTVTRDNTEQRQARELREAVIGMTSHELGNPLATIMLVLKLLADPSYGELPPKKREMVGLGVTAAERMKRLIADFLTVERLRSGQLDFHVETLDLASLVDEVVRSMEPAAESAGIGLEETRPSGPLTVRGDPDRLVQVLVNLVSNALKFTPRGRRVEVAAATQGDCVRVAVSDEGPGIPADFKPRVFQRFARAPNVKERGSGLGLSISKGIIERLGGQIGFRDRPGGGTVFWFELPAARAAPPARPSPIC